MSATPAPELIGASAFWMLTALALTTMLQPSASDRYLKPSGISWARSSPFVVLSDAVIIVMWAVAGWAHDISFFRAFTLAGRHLEFDTENAESISSQNIYANLMLFGLGPLPQIIKLFGVVGAPFTQTLGALYVTGAAVAAVTFVAKSQAFDSAERSQSKLSYHVAKSLERISSWISCLAISSQVAAYLYPVLVIFPKRMDPVFMIVSALYLFGIPAVVVIGSARLRYKILIGVPILAVAFWMPAELAKHAEDISKIPQYLYQPYLYIICTIVFTIAIAGGLVFCALSFRLVASWFEKWLGKRRHSKAIDEDYLDFAPITFAFANLLCGFVYFAYIYDSTDTGKPSWTEMLG